MKTKTLFFGLAVLTASLTSCNMLKGTQTSNTTSNQTTSTTQSNGLQMGKYAGAAIDQLYSQYQIDKKIDMTNFQNIASILNLTGAARDLNNNKSDKTYRSNFAMGLVMGSMHITENNSEAITDEIADLISEDKINEVEDSIKKGEVDQNQVKEITDNVTDIFDIIKK